MANFIFDYILNRYRLKDTTNLNVEDVPYNNMLPLQEVTINNITNIPIINIYEKNGSKLNICSIGAYDQFFSDYSIEVDTNTNTLRIRKNVDRTAITIVKLIKNS